MARHSFVKRRQCTEMYWNRVETKRYVADRKCVDWNGKGLELFCIVMAKYSKAIPCIGEESQCAALKSCGIALY